MGRRYRPFALSAPLLGTKRGKPVAHGGGRVGPFEGVRDDGDEIVRETEVGEVLERQVDGAAHGAGGAQAAELVELPLLARPPDAHERRSGELGSAAWRFVVMAAACGRALIPR